MSCAIYSRLGSDPDLGELVEMFVDEMAGRVDNMLARFDAADWNELRRAAHQLKGAAGSYGFDGLTSYAARLEAVSLDTTPEDQIRESLEELVALCRQIRAGAPADPA